MNKDILFNHPILGDISFKDIINDLETMLQDTSLFEELVFQLLRQSELNDEEISSLFNYSIINRLEWIIYILKKSK